LKEEGSSRPGAKVPCPDDFRSGPPTAEAYLKLPEQIDGVRIRRPSGMIAGTSSYPFDKPSPPAPHARGRTVGHGDWGFFHSETLDRVPRPWSFPSSLDNPGCRWLQALKNLYANPVTFPASISPEGGMLLHSIVRNSRPRVVVETGTFLGVSALWIAAALAENGQGGVLHCFDDFVPIQPGPWRTQGITGGVLEQVARNISEAGLSDHVVLHPGSTRWELKAAHDELRSAGGVQLAYLDADHRPMGVCQDFWGVEQLVPTGGLIILHDTFPGVCGDDGPRFLLDHVNDIAVGTYQPLDLYLSPINYGMGLLRRVG
jgi:predicted O-methyltransferase YrrM